MGVGGGRVSAPTRRRVGPVRARADGRAFRCGGGSALLGCAWSRPWPEGGGLWWGIRRGLAWRSDGSSCRLIAWWQAAGPGVCEVLAPIAAIARMAVAPWDGGDGVGAQLFRQLAGGERRAARVGPLAAVETVQLRKQLVGW